MHHHRLNSSPLVGFVGLTLVYDADFNQYFLHHAANDALNDSNILHLCG
jgi:hypothetical protein